MINIFKTEQSVIRTIDAFEDGAWVQMVDPSVQELNKVSEAYDIADCPCSKKRALKKI